LEGPLTTGGDARSEPRRRSRGRGPQFSIQKIVGGPEMLKSIGVRARPTWIRGPARRDGDEIALDGGVAEKYAVSDAEYGATLLFGLGNLGKLGEIVEVENPDARLIDAVRLTDTWRALAFAETHGFLWHGPERVWGMRGDVRPGRPPPEIPYEVWQS
jgi:hypothetical protein